MLHSVTASLYCWILQCQTNWPFRVFSTQKSFTRILFFWLVYTQNDITIFLYFAIIGWLPNSMTKMNFLHTIFSRLSYCMIFLSVKQKKMFFSLQLLWNFFVTLGKLTYCLYTFGKENHIIWIKFYEVTKCLSKIIKIIFNPYFSRNFP